MGTSRERPSPAPRSSGRLGSADRWGCRRERRTLHTFEGHCTSKNGASPELTLIKAPVLETSVWAAAGKTGDSPFFAAQSYKPRTSNTFNRQHLMWNPFKKRQQWKTLLCWSGMLAGVWLAARVRRTPAWSPGPGPVCVDFACSLHICMVYFWVLCLPPTAVMNRRR